MGSAVIKVNPWTKTPPTKQGEYWHWTGDELTGVTSRTIRNAIRKYDGSTRSGFIFAYLDDLFDEVIPEESLPIPNSHGYRMDKWGQIWTCHKHGGAGGELCRHWRKMTPVLFEDGYLKINIILNGKMRQRFVHNLVLETFVGPRPPGMHGCHFPDPTPTNCNLDNLRWDTPQSNAEDRRIAGRQTFGGCLNRHKNRLTEDQVHEIVRLHAAGESKHSLARRFGVSRQLIGGIFRGKSWRQTILKNRESRKLMYSDADPLDLLMIGWSEASERQRQLFLSWTKEQGNVP